MKVLIACECSGEFRDAFLALGHDAISCDLKPTRKPGPHYQGDVRDILYQSWDLLIAHPVCRYMTNAGVRWLFHPEDKLLPWDQRRRHPQYPVRWDDMTKGTEFFKLFLNANHIPKRAVENPILHGYAITLIGRRADQYVQPWWFGDPFSKATGWWLEGLDKLEPTHSKADYPNGIKQECWLMPPGPDREELRSKTYPGIAKAGAMQWTR